MPFSNPARNPLDLEIPGADDRAPARRDGNAVRSTVLVILLAAMLGVVVAPSGSNEPAVADGVPTVEFAWQDHLPACAVDADRDVVRCYRSEGEMDAAEALVEPVVVANDGDVLAAGSRCRSWVKVYDRTWYRGRTLYFRDMYWWQNLRNYGFDNRAESIRTSDCQVTVASSDHGQGTRRTYRSGYQSYSSLSWHGNRVSSIYLQN